MDKKHVSRAIKSSLGALPLVGPLINALVPYNAKFASKQKAKAARGKRTRPSNRRKSASKTMLGPPRSLQSIRSGTYGPTNSGSNAALEKFRQMSREAIGELTGSAGPVFSAQRGTRNSISFSQAHLAQEETDRSYRNAVRISVTSVDGGTASGQPIMAITAPNSTVSAGRPFQNGSATGSNVFVLGLTPSTISDNLGQLEQIFEANAIRYLKIRYVPTVGDYTTTAVNTNVSLGLAIMNDEEGSGSVATTFSAMSDLERFESNHVTKPFELEYCHTGTTTWFANTNAAEPDLIHQGAILGSFDTAPTVGGASTPGPVYGHTTCFCVCDFYGLRPKTTAIDVDEKGVKLPIQLKPLGSDRLTDSKATGNCVSSDVCEYVKVEQSPLVRQLSVVTQMGSPRKEISVVRSKSVR